MPVKSVVEKPIQETESLPENTFIIVRGQPGSGKSTLIESVQHAFEFVLIDPDITHTQPAEFDEYVQQRVYEDMSFATLPIERQYYRFHTYKCVEALKAGKAVIWAQPWSNVDGINLTLENIRELVSPDILPIIIELTISEEEAARRIDNRFKLKEHRLSLEEFEEKFRNKFSVIDPNLFDPNCIYIKLDSNSAAYNREVFLHFLSILSMTS